MDPPDRPSLSRMQRFWIRWCRFAVRVFYRRREAHGLEKLPRDGPIMVCANHVNALADGVVLQAFSPRLLHPVARSGLFKSRMVRSVLHMIQAIPVYRRRSASDDPERNREAFQRCFELFRNGGALLIFPEGQSHSEARLRELKTGAARIALGALEENGTAPLLVPAGLTFTHKGHFRGSVLVNFGTPLVVERLPEENAQDSLIRVTDELRHALMDVTLNVESWEELKLLERLERFLAFRRGRYRQRSLEMRFRAMKKLHEVQQHLREQAPEQVEKLTRQLHRFERLCERFGVRDYQLTIRYTAGQVAFYMLRSIVFLTLVLPVAVWGWLNNAVPFHLTRLLALRLARGRDQFDTAGIAIGLFLFPLFWILQATLVFYFWSAKAVLVYLATLVPATAIAVIVRQQRRFLMENVRVFFLFIMRRDVRAYLESNRRQIESELARLTRLARRLEADRTVDALDSQTHRKSDDHA